MKGEIYNNTIIVGDFNTPLISMDRSTKKKINKEMQTLNDTLDQLDLIDIYRTFHPKTMNFTFFSSAHGVLFIWSFLAVGVVVSMVCQGFFVREACVGDLLGGAGFRLSGVQCSVQ